MEDMLEVRSQHEEFLSEFEADVHHVLHELVLPLWNVRAKRFRTTLYGYVMTVFSRIDLLATYFAGNRRPGEQGKRMRRFMDQYWDTNPEAVRVSISMWRNTLMHTSQPRILVDNPVNPTLSYEWLLHWGEPLTPEQHFVLALSRPGVMKLDMGLTYLIADLRRVTEAYLWHLARDADLQSKYAAVEGELNKRKL